MTQIILINDEVNECAICGYVCLVLHCPVPFDFNTKAIQSEQTKPYLLSSTKTMKKNNIFIK